MEQIKATRSKKLSGDTSYRSLFRRVIVLALQVREEPHRVEAQSLHLAPIDIRSANAVRNCFTQIGLDTANCFQRHQIETDTPNTRGNCVKHAAWQRFLRYVGKGRSSYLL